MAVSVKGSLISSQVDISSKAELVDAEINTRTGPHVSVASLYRPPTNVQNGCNYIDDNLTAAINQLCIKYPENPIWIGRDANLPEIDWRSDSVTGCKYNQNINSKFLTYCNKNGLEQTVDLPTRYDNLLDILLTNRPSLMSRTDSVLGVSDHQGILASSLVKPRYKRPVK